MTTQVEVGPVDKLEQYLRQLEDSYSCSEIDTFQRCRKKAKLEYVLRLGDPAPHIPADAGTVMHAGLGTLRRTGDLDKAIVALEAEHARLFAWVPSMGKDYSLPRQYMIEHMRDVLIKYAMLVYKNDRLAIVSPEHVEIAFVVTLPSSDGPPAVLYGRIDWIGVHESTRRIAPVDIKTTKSWGIDFESRFDPGLQGDMYTYVCKQLFLNESVQGFYIDGVLLQVTEKDPANWFNRVFINKSPIDMKEFERETYWWIQQIRKAKADNWWPKSTNQCAAYGGCAFRRVCTGHDNPNTIGNYPVRPPKGFHFLEETL